ncbi:MAG: 50S ribosomal protein L27, partial [Pseudomonadota bacterium]
IRQRGTKYHPGIFVGRGKDDTLFARADGVVQFVVRGKQQRTYVDIVPLEMEEATA